MEGHGVKNKVSFIAVEGADGVGKSTVLRLLVPELVRRGGFGGYLFFHWKPSAANISRDRIPEDDPHDPRGKAPRGTLASFAFLAYHWLGFMHGHLRFVRPAIRSGLLVVADRCAYDAVLDPKRFRLKLPPWALKLFARLLPRPDAAILLHADPAVIRARKPELTVGEIEAYQRALLGCGLMANPIPVPAEDRPEAVVSAILAKL